MTQKQKAKAIIERLKEQGKDIEAPHISAMVIIGYLNDLAAIGCLESAFEITSVGKSVKAICEEFDWKPSNDDIKDFVIGMVEESERPAIAYFITKYRDDRENLLEEIEEAKNNPPDEN